MSDYTSVKLPESIANFIGDAALIADPVGQSPCQVRSFERGKDRFFLKFSPSIYAATTYSVARESQVLNWLAGRLNVPEVVLTAETPEGEYMVTRGVPGVPLSARIEARAPVLELFGEALRQVQTVSTADCPFDAGAPTRLRELEYLMAQGLVAEDYDLTPWPGLRTPQDLLAHLHATLSEQDLVFAHGDITDDNIFVDARDRLYFIDLGRGGLADRWMDIAFVHRELRERVSDDAALRFLETLNRPDSPARRTFFEQMDELF